MPTQSLNVITLKPDQLTAMPTLVQISEGRSFPVTGDGCGIVVVFYSSESAQVTIKGGDGVFAGKDLKLTLAGEKYLFLQLESGPYMKYSGENKGKIVIEGSSSATVGVIQLG